jgi:uncharacterized protein
MVFVDTSVWFAKFVPDDPEHSRVTAWFDSAKDLLLTTDYCVSETLTLLVARRRRQRALIAGRAFFDRSLADIHFMTEAQINRAWILFQQGPATNWSFTDCTSKIVMDELGIQTAAALDEHIWQFGNVTVVP